MLQHSEIYTCRNVPFISFVSFPKGAYVFVPVLLIRIVRSGHLVQSCKETSFPINFVHRKRRFFSTLPIRYGLEKAQKHFWSSWNVYLAGLVRYSFFFVFFVHLYVSPFHAIIAKLVSFFCGNSVVTRMKTCLSIEPKKSGRLPTLTGQKPWNATHFEDLIIISLYIFSVLTSSCW